MLINSEEPVPSGSSTNASEYKEPTTNAQNSEINETNQPISEVSIQCNELKEEHNGCSKPNADMVKKIF